MQQAKLEWHEIPTDSIVVGERARVDLGDDFEDLKKSIELRGLFHPIIINKKDGELVSGFRRLKCHKDLGIKTVGVRFYEDLTDEEKLIIELEENIHKTLTWDELASIRTRMHFLKQKIHGAAKRHVEGEGWGIKESAEELGVSEATISQDLSLVRALEIVPEIKNLTSRKQALKAMNRVEEVAILNAIAEREVTTEGVSVPDYILIHGDAVEAIKDRIDDETISLVIFDPPWGIDVHRIASSRGPKGEKTSYKDDSAFTALTTTMNLLPELYRVMQEDAHMYFFVGTQFREIYFDILTKYVGFHRHLNILDLFFPSARNETGHLRELIDSRMEKQLWEFHVEEVPLMWVKDGGGFTDFEYKFMSRYETILFCSKGQKKPLNEVVSNVFEYNRPLSTERIHTQEKPVELIQRLIRISTQKNEFVLDPCAGSFVTAAAAVRTGRMSISIEEDKVAYMKGVDRMKGIITGGGDDTIPESDSVEQT